MANQSRGDRVQIPHLLPVKRISHSTQAQRTQPKCLTGHLAGGGGFQEQKGWSVSSNKFIEGSKARNVHEKLLESGYLDWHHRKA